VSLTFPFQLDRIRDCTLAQEEKLRAWPELFADAIAIGGVVHVYANGHSRIALEELCVRMGSADWVSIPFSQRICPHLLMW